MLPFCDKCGKEVPPSNDATIIQAIKNDAPATTLFFGARHFLPTEDCEGSPSRAQHIEGQLRDTRVNYPYRKEEEEAWREALQEARRRYG